MKGESRLKRRFRVTVGGKVFEVEIEEIGIEELPAAPTPSPAPAPIGEHRTVPTVIPESKIEKAKAPGLVRAPIPGTIVSIKCREGDNVRAGDPLLVLESMKMENEIYSPVSGRVKRVYVSEGTSVNAGEALVEIE
ncbi:MAG: biotin/lipoyl-containing protein [Nitrososphaerota archaeon]